MKLRLLTIFACLGLAACEEPVPPLEITAEPATVTFLQGVPPNRIRADQTQAVVRAYQESTNESGKLIRTEIAGARCSLTSDHLRANVITPQIVRLPKYDQNAKLDNRGVPPSILVECKHDGKSASALLAAKPGEIVAGSGNLIADMILIAGSAAVAATADWKYEPYVFVFFK